MVDGYLPILGGKLFSQQQPLSLACNWIWVAATARSEVIPLRLPPNYKDSQFSANPNRLVSTSVPKRMPPLYAKDITRYRMSSSSYPLYPAQSMASRSLWCGPGIPPASSRCRPRFPSARAAQSSSGSIEPRPALA